MGRGQSGGERFSPPTLLRNLGDPRRRISRTCVREKKQNNDKNTFSFNFNPQFFFFFFFYSYTHFDGKEGRRHIDKIKLVTLLKKEENWRPETGPVRFAKRNKTMIKIRFRSILILNFFSSSFFTATPISMERKDVAILIKSNL